MLRIGDIPDAQADNKGEFTEGSPLTDIPATKTKAAWFNSLQHELVNVVENYGFKLNSNNDEQIADILNKNTPLRTNAIPVLRKTSGILCHAEMNTPDNRWQLTASENGRISIPDQQTFIWRGAWQIISDEFPVNRRSFYTVANKTYHLRWTPRLGFLLNDLANPGYNPSKLPENHACFDGQYDDVLIALITTDGNNHATITPYKNKSILTCRWDITTRSCVNSNVVDQPFVQWPPNVMLPLNWARAATPHMMGISGFNLGYQYRSGAQTNDNTFGIIAPRNCAYFYDYHTSCTSSDTQWHFWLRA